MSYMLGIVSTVLYENQPICYVFEVFSCGPLYFCWICVQQCLQYTTKTNLRSITSLNKCEYINKGNNKITELRTILQRESQNSYLYKQTKSVNNRKTVKTVMTLTWYRHFKRNGGLNQILRRQTSRSHYVSKVPAVTVTVFKYRNKIGKIVVKAVPYSVT